MATKEDAAKTVENAVSNGENLVKLKKQSAKLNTITQDLLKCNFDYLDKPEYQIVFDELNVSGTIDLIKKLVKSYVESNVETKMGSINDDCIKFASYLIELSMQLGNIQGHAFHSEQNLKYYTSQVSRQAEAVANKNGLNLSQSDFVVIARLNSKTPRENLANLQTASSVLTNFYFACKQFLEVLLSLSNRKVSQW